jgi:glycosyltransferase involved in cell wall biosynthesis
VPLASVIIPAHNEASVIARCLGALLRGSQPGELEIIVACNGCSDATADIARQVAPMATVLDLAEASKVAALNAGDDAATVFPRIYLDADVELTIEDLRRTVKAFEEPGVLCAAPRPEFVLDERPWTIRSFYRIWSRIPYLTEDMVGSGVYALNAVGRSRFGHFPSLTADDQFIMELFARPERRSVPDATFRLHTPRRLSGLLAMRTRVYRGNWELSRSAASGGQGPTPAGRMVVDLARRDPRQAPAVALYLGVNLLARYRAKRNPHARWERDLSARAAS